MKSAAQAPLVAEDDWTTQQRPIASIPRTFPREAPGAEGDAPMDESEATLVLSAADQAMLVAAAKAEKGRGPPDLPPAAAPAAAAAASPAAGLQLGPVGELPAFAEPPEERRFSGRWVLVLLAATGAAAAGGFAAAELVRASRGESSPNDSTEPARADDARR